MSSASRIYCMDPGFSDSEGEGEKAPLLTTCSGRSLSSSPCHRAASNLQDVNHGEENGTSLSSLLPNSNTHMLTRTISPHCHRAGDSDDKFSGLRKARRTLILAASLCLLFTVAEAAGGLIAGSLALLTDAAHMLSDFASFLISLFAIWVAQKPATKKMSFGFYRAEVVGALASVFIIWILTGILVYKAVERVQNGSHHEINAKVMLITSGLGVAINIIMGLILHQPGGSHLHSHGLADHSHGHSHGGSGGDAQNINVRAAFVHVVGDLVQSVGVLIAAYIIYYHPDYSIVDPICTFLFSILVLLTTVRIVRDCLHVLMEGSPKNVSYTAVKQDLENIDGVRTAHNLHMWCLTMGKSALAVHLAIEPSVVNKQQEVLEEAQRIAKTKYNMIHTTIQVEVYHRDMDDCVMCKDPVD